MNGAVLRKRRDRQKHEKKEGSNRKREKQSPCMFLRRAPKKNFWAALASKGGDNCSHVRKIAADLVHNFR